MKLKLAKSLLKVLIEKLPEKDPSRYHFSEFVKEYSYRNDDTVHEVASHKINKKTIDLLYKHIEEVNDPRKTKRLKGQLNALVRINENPAGAKISKLENLEHGIKQYMRTVEDVIVFRRNKDDGALQPFLVTEVKYHKATSSSYGYSPAYVRMSLKAIDMDKVSTEGVTFETGDFRKKEISVKELLELKDLYPSNVSFKEEYLKELKLYDDYKTQLGLQFLGSGKGKNLDGSWGRSIVPLEVESVRQRLVIDTPEDWENKTKSEPIEYLEEPKEEDRLKIVPQHTNLQLFNLTTHALMKVHVSNLELYKYDTGVIDKLILPEQHKDLIQIMVQGTGDIMEDIVEGKTGGIIVIATGTPGTGKTLTAEVYSEVVKRPLYVVQSSQLGIEIDTLESNLKRILLQANRWNAILLIDEADVYIHARGNDLTQNAVVGVFLRVLEYYKGILFMTSNRGVLIDDAIMSRATAHIRYTTPSKENLGKIWNVLIEQFKMDVDAKVIKEAVKEFPHLSGRDVKNMLKLTKLLAERKKEKISINLIKHVSQFLDVNIKGDKE